MKMFGLKKVMALWLVVLCICFAAGCGKQQAEKQPSAGYDVVDAQGTTVHLDAKPQRILTYTSGADEVLLGLVEPERLVAINDGLADSRMSNISELVKGIQPTIPRNPPVELVMSLRPDLVIVQDWIQADNIASLRDLGIKVVVCRSPRSIKDIQETIGIMATAVGEPERGEKLIELMNKELAAIAAKVEAIPVEQRQKKIAIISVMQGFGGVNSLVEDICRYAQCQDVKILAGIKKGQSITKEKLVAGNPDFVLFPVYLNDGRTSEERYGEEFMKDPSFESMSAVKQGHVRRPWARYLYNISQNFVFGVQEVARALYGEEFDQPRDKHLKAY